MKYFIWEYACQNSDLAEFLQMALKLINRLNQFKAVININLFWFRENSNCFQNTCSKTIELFRCYCITWLGDFFVGDLCFRSDQRMEHRYQAIYIAALSFHRSSDLLVVDYCLRRIFDLFSRLREFSKINATLPFETLMVWHCGSSICQPPAYNCSNSRNKNFPLKALTFDKRETDLRALKVGDINRPNYKTYNKYGENDYRFEYQVFQMLLLAGIRIIFDKGYDRDCFIGGL